MVLLEEKSGISSVLSEIRKWWRDIVVRSGIIVVILLLAVAFVLTIVLVSPSSSLPDDDLQQQSNINNDMSNADAGLNSGSADSSDSGSSSAHNIFNNNNNNNGEEEEELVPTYLPTSSPTRATFYGIGVTTLSPSPTFKKIPTEEPSSFPSFLRGSTMNPLSNSFPTESPTTSNISNMSLPTSSDPSSSTTQLPSTALPQTTSPPTPEPTPGPTGRPTTTTIQPSEQPSTTTSGTTTTVFGSYEVLESVPHDLGAFTQGLELVRPISTREEGEEQYYYESTGLFGQSSMRIVNLSTGDVIYQHDLPDTYFAEGMTYFGNGKLIQITWQSNTAFIYNATTLEVIEVLPSYTTTNGEGWGICFATIDDDEEEQTAQTNNVFYVTDGTHYLHRWDSTTFDFLGKVPVHIIQRSIIRDGEGDDSSIILSNTTIADLNELEWDRHSHTVLSNVWYEDYLLRIDPTTGFVTHRYDLKTLYQNSYHSVLNGIAITDTPNEIWVTGKLWPNMYRVRLID